MGGWEVGVGGWRQVTKETDTKREATLLMDLHADKVTEKHRQCVTLPPVFAVNTRGSGLKLPRAAAEGSRHSLLVRAPDS